MIDPMIIFIQNTLKFKYSNEIFEKYPGSNVVCWMTRSKGKYECNIYDVMKQKLR